MELILHAGLYKAGSSFIQRTFKENDECLINGGICYHVAGMQYGNAKYLHRQLVRGDFRAAQRELSRHISEATNHNSKAFLMSSEYLFRDFTKGNLLGKFSEICDKLEVKLSKIIIFFRDPISHAISTYCNDAGRKDLGDFREWVRYAYKLPQEISIFRSIFNERSDINWDLFHYSTQERIMMDLGASLGVGKLNAPSNSAVNVSVTLSEAFVLNGMYRIDRKLASEMRLKMKSMDKSIKADDRRLRGWCEFVARDALLPHRDNFEWLGSQLKSGGSIINHDMCHDPASENSFSFEFSRDQLECIFAFLSRTRMDSFSNRFYRLIRSG